MSWSQPQTWPENTLAPTEDFLAWFLTLTETEQLSIMFKLRQCQEEAARCFQMDHASLQSQQVHNHEVICKLMEKVAALNDIIVRAYTGCKCGQSPIQVAEQDMLNKLSGS